METPAPMSSPPSAMTPPPMPMRPPTSPPGPPSPACAMTSSEPGIAARSWLTSLGGPSLRRKARMMPIAFVAVAASRPVFCVTRARSSSMAVSSEAGGCFGRSGEEIKLIIATGHPGRGTAAIRDPWETAGDWIPALRGACPWACRRQDPRASAGMTVEWWPGQSRTPKTETESNGATMLEDGKILIGKSTKPEYLTLRLANRHGLVTGATGTGKTVTLQVLAEGFSNAGVPVFAADIKGDLSGVALLGDGKPPFVKRAQEIGIEYTPDRFPVAFWDLFGEQGHPIRATVSEMGPLLLARLLELNDVQEGVLNIAFRVADEANLPVLDLKDLRALLNFVVENADTVSAKYGNVAKASVASVQRQLLMLENQGADKFFGEPALNLQDFMKTDRDGRGIINILAADKLMTKPRLYASFLLWMLSELFEALPEVGDLDKPKLVFFFDEAHLLFNDAPKPLLDAVEQVVRLIRSKGVGVYFVTQNPLDVPQTVLAQLGNRAQHALRAFTPRDQKAVRAAAETFRQNPAFDTAKVIMELAVGEALVSTLEERGTPSIVERTLVAPPTARVGPVTDAERKAIVQASALRGKYEETLDSESAYEMLAKRKQMAEQPAQEASTSGGLGGILGKITDALGGGSQPQAQQPGKGKGAQRMSTTEVIIRSMATSAARSVGTQITRAVLRNVLGGILGSAAGGSGGGGGRRRSSRAADLDAGARTSSGDFMGDMSDLIQGGG